MADVHLNLRIGGFTILETDPSTGNKVKTGHTHAAIMRGSFIVQQAGSERAKERGQRNVHAFVRGALIETWFGQTPQWDLTGHREVTYNPFTDTSFRFRDNDEPVHPEQVFEGIILTRKPNGKYGVFVPRTE